MCAFVFQGKAGTPGVQGPVGPKGERGERVSRPLPSCIFPSLIR